jgi:transposase
VYDAWNKQPQKTVAYFRQTTVLFARLPAQRRRYCCAKFLLGHAYAKVPDSLRTVQVLRRLCHELADQQQLVLTQLAALNQDVAVLLAAEPELARKRQQLTSIPGTGLTMAVVVVAETSGFALVENERQLASSAGLAVVQRQSGLLSHATRISKRGYTRLRTALYLPALSSPRHNPRRIAFYGRLRRRHPSGKPGLIAVMHKPLVLCYALWKNDQAYTPDYPTAHQSGHKIAPATEVSRGYAG